MGKMQRTKGAVGERELAKLIRENLHMDCQRRIEQTRDSGHDLDLMDYAIEVKRAKTMTLNAWWKQTVENAAAAGMIPVLAYRIDNKKWMVVMSFSDLLDGFAGTEKTAERIVTIPLNGWFDLVKLRL